MVNLPSVRHLRHLLALHDCGHFGRAAEACRVTQSTLSASIKELEAVLEATLVDRTKRRVVLTPVGIETVERARRILKDIEDLVSFTASAREPLSGALRMGAIPTVGPFLLPRVLPGFSSAWLRANKRHSNMTALPTAANSAQKQKATGDQDDGGRGAVDTKCCGFCAA